MKIPRMDLLKAVKLAEPALATKPIIEELTYFWFTGESIVAYNDILGITVPLQTEFQGGLKGSLLIGLLEKSRAREVEFILGENELLVKAANARLSLSFADIQRAIWTEPLFEKPIEFPITNEFLQAIDDVLVSVGYDTSIPDQLGVTLLPDTNILYFFTTDSKTISRAMLPFDCNGLPERMILPLTFCQQLLSLCRKGGRLLLSANSLCAINSNNVHLFARLIETTRPLEFHSTVDNAMAQLQGNTMVPIPNRFKLALERVSIVLSVNVGEPALFSIADGVLHMQAKTGLGEINDSMRLVEDHGKIDVHVDPLLIKRAVDSCSSFCIGPSCVFLSKEPHFMHLISLTDR